MSTLKPRPKPPAPNSPLAIALERARELDERMRPLQAKIRAALESAPVRELEQRMRPVRDEMRAFVKRYEEVQGEHLRQIAAMQRKSDRLLGVRDALAGALRSADLEIRERRPQSRAGRPGGKTLDRDLRWLAIFEEAKREKPRSSERQVFQAVRKKIEEAIKKGTGNVAAHGIKHAPPDNTLRSALQRARDAKRKAALTLADGQESERTKR